MKALATNGSNYVAITGKTYFLMITYQELDYEKLVSSTKLYGATEGTSRVEVVKTKPFLKASLLKSIPILIHD